MKLNGWQRLWVVITALIVLLLLVVTPLTYVSEGVPLTASLWLKLIGFAVGWPIALYAIGWTIGWIFRGFRGG